MISLSRNVYLKRILAAVFFIFLVLILLEFFAPSASADPLHKTQKQSASTAPFKLERSDQTTTTTTTTTTTVPPTTVKPVITTPKAPVVIAPPGPGDEIYHRLAQCESGDPTYNGSSGYDGAFQFLPSTWNSMNTGYAFAYEAPFEVQLDAAKRLIARSGWGQFPGCARKLGML